MSELSELYQQVILDHNKRPRNFGRLATANRTAEGYNPLCGDHITLYVELEDDVIRDIAFEGSGCAVSKASASMMTETLKGKNLEEADALFDSFHALVTGRSSAEGAASAPGGSVGAGLAAGARAAAASARTASAAAGARVGAAEAATARTGLPAAGARAAEAAGARTAQAGAGDSSTVDSGATLTATSPGAFSALGKLAVFSGVSEFPMRVKCATLAWHTVRAALEGKHEPVSTE